MDRLANLNDESTGNFKKPKTTKRKHDSSSSGSCCCCCFKCCCDGKKCFISIWSTWYCLLIVLIHAYLMKNQIEIIIGLFDELSSEAAGFRLSASANGTTTMSGAEAARLAPTKTSLWWESDFLLLPSTASYLVSNRTLLINENLLEFLDLFKPAVRLQQLIVRLSMLAVSLLALLVFLTCSLKKVRNYANDGVKFGRDFFAENLHYHRKHYTQENYLNKLKKKSDNKNDSSTNRQSNTSTCSNDSFTITTSTAGSSSISTMNKQSHRIGTNSHHQPQQQQQNVTKKSRYSSARNPVTNILVVMWHHFLPMSSFFHLVSVLFLILPNLIYTPINTLKRDLDLYNNKTCFSMSKINITNCIIDKLFNQNNGIVSKLVNVPSVGTTPAVAASTEALSSPNDFIFFDKEYFLLQLNDYLLELVSICLALVTLSIRYGSVFWYTNKTLSYLITLVGFVSSIQQLFQLYSFLYISKQTLLSRLSKSILKIIYFKLKSNADAATSSGAETSDVTGFDDFYLINSIGKLILIYAVLGTLVLLTVVPAYVFTYLKYKERFFIEESLFLKSFFNLSTHLKENMTATGDSSNDLKLDKLNFLQAGLNSEQQLSDLTLINLKKNCCFNYCPHLIATVQLILICLCKLPFCYDFILYFNNHKDFGIMLCIIVEIMHTIILLFIWLILTLKTEWNMHLRTSYSICHWTYHLKQNEKLEAAYLHEHNLDVKSFVNVIEDKVCGANDDERAVRVSMYQTTMVGPSTTDAAIRKQPAINKKAHIDDDRFGTSMDDDHNNDENDSDDDGEENDDDDGGDGDIIELPITRETKMRTRQLSTSDDLLNSETIYRNEIRKSIRNMLLKQKRNSAAITSTSTTTSSSKSTPYGNSFADATNHVNTIGANFLASSSSSNHNYFKNNTISNATNHKQQRHKLVGNTYHQQQLQLPPPPLPPQSFNKHASNNHHHINLVQTSNVDQPKQFTRLVGTGVYLTTSPSFAAEASNKQNGPAVAGPPHNKHPSTVTTTILTSSVFELPTTTNNLVENQPVIYLNRPHGKEYESRV